LYTATTGNAIQHGSQFPIGRPNILDSDNSTRFALLSAWLRWCGQSHDCNKHKIKSKLALPTRVLYVGDPKDPGYASDFVCLVRISKTSRERYIALSHCWGRLSDEEKKRFCTTQANIVRRLRGFGLSELPQSFQDAVKVTRELGVLYLWIDSLCIIQDGDHGQDWSRESSQMEHIFSNAYCTIAATAAAHSDDGFLQRRTGFESIHVQDASGRQFYINSDVDDFDNDVEKALLNTRAWVMQEGVLARRTIHFSAKQTYWECGEGIYCENLTMLKRYELCTARFKTLLTRRFLSFPTDRYFLLDPDFPHRLLSSGMKRTLDCISFLFKNTQGGTLQFLPTGVLRYLGWRIASQMLCRVTADMASSRDTSTEPSFGRRPKR
jgi:hypothetical protein